MDTFEECKKVLAHCNALRLCWFGKELTEHIQKTMDGSPEDRLESLLCSSDIIESAFGKYKNYIQANPMVGITNLCLAAFTGKLTK
ncbi:hypothetical protein MM239_12775 [Belliella sp. DSM 111904]|uniref:Transposase n=1 Tax=Belliella filtrata TaxID=2923435 RepID=A0ABS9V230_9BACT|nr:hypothetical protein [Belliella filtrata]MCH7410274.1 hypothetical protein [Belliella filtrata]